MAAELLKSKLMKTGTKTNDQRKEETLRIVSGLKNTRMIGMSVGIIGLVGFSLVPPVNFKHLFVFILLSATAYITGFFLGFLFGIPKRNEDNESVYDLNTNLVDISDWLTKIIIGIGLIEIKSMAGFLESAGVYVRDAIGGDDSVKVFTIFIIVYFSIFGLYYGFNYMRLYLSGLYKGADDNLMNEALAEKGDVLSDSDLAWEGDNKKLDTETLKTLDDYTQLLKSTKTEAEYSFTDWYYKGVNAFTNEEYEKLIGYMQKAIEIDPKAPFAADAHLYQALGYSGLGLNEKAIEVNSRIISNYKNYNNMYLVHYNNGVYYNKLNNPEIAIEEYSKAIALKPDYAIAYNNKGDLLIKQNKFDEALPLFEKAISLDPATPYPYYNLSYIYADRNEKELMMKNLKKAIELNPKYITNAITEEVFKKFKEDEDFKLLVNI